MDTGAGGGGSGAIGGTIRMVLLPETSDQYSVAMAYDITTTENRRYVSKDGTWEVSTAIPYTLAGAKRLVVLPETSDQYSVAIVQSTTSSANVCQRPISIALAAL